VTYDDLRNVAVLYQLLHRLESDIEGRIARRLAELADTLSDETALMARNNEADIEQVIRRRIAQLANTDDDLLRAMFTELGVLSSMILSIRKGNRDAS
jgi:hypothetical protein